MSNLTTSEKNKANYFNDEIIAEYKKDSATFWDLSWYQGEGYYLGKAIRNNMTKLPKEMWTKKLVEKFNRLYA